MHKDDLAHIAKRIASHGDEGAFRELFNAYFDKLLFFSNSFLKNRPLAEEAVEDVFIKLWESRQTLMSIDNLHYYLYRAVKNSTINYLAKFKRQSHLPLDDLRVDLGVEMRDPESMLISAEALAAVHRAIDQLPDQCKLIFFLVKEQRLRYREVAELLQLSVKTVETQMSIALGRLVHAWPTSFPLGIRSSKK